MSDRSISINPKKDADSILFKVKKFEYNMYKIEHPSVKGFLRVANIPINILKVRDEKFANVPNMVNIPDHMRYFISYHPMVGYVNQGEKIKSAKRWQPQFINSSKKQDLFSYIIKEQTDEPWNEYVLQGETPVMLRTKTTLNTAYLYPEYSNDLGDPIIHAIHNTSISVSVDSNAEAGMV